MSNNIKCSECAYGVCVTDTDVASGYYYNCGLKENGTIATRERELRVTPWGACDRGGRRRRDGEVEGSCFVGPVFYNGADNGSYFNAPKVLSLSGEK